MINNKQNFDKILFIGTFADDQYYDFLFEQGLYKQQAANSVEKFYIEGLVQAKKDVEILSGLVTVPYPKTKVKYLEAHDSEFIGCNIKNIEFINYPFINILSQNKNITKYAKKWALSNVNKNVLVIVYSLRVPFLKAAEILKKHMSNCKVICIVPDLPQYMHSNNNILRNIATNINKTWMNQLLPVVDGYILYSKHMAEALNIENKPWTVIEGIFDSTDEKCKEIRDRNLNMGIKKIIYAGGLSRMYGIDNLINGFINANINGAILELYGDGEFKEEILEISKVHDNVKYKGLVNRKDLRSVLISADLLINPRPTKGEFTKYSCPSKTLEYMSTGVPVLMTKLEGIPDEYYDYVYSIEKDDSEGIADAINKVFDIPSEKRIQLAHEAKEFIYNKKNPRVQIEKMFSLIEKI